MPNEQELLERIRTLEEQNSALQDKLDMIYAILAPDFEVGDESDLEDGGESPFVQIEGHQKKHN
jgi:hypothetical protein